MVFTTALSDIGLEPGSRITIPNVNWQAFESILQELGESRGSRIAYSQNTLEVMVPLPDHERSKILISDIVKALLRHQARDWESLGSTTFRREIKAAGLEPDDCFYIKNYRAVVGRNRLDLAVDPPPDLAIESDYTSKTRLDAYLSLRVPELWVYDRGLKIYVLKNEDYCEVNMSPIFPNFLVKEKVEGVIAQARSMPSSQALREFERDL